MDKYCLLHDNIVTYTHKIGDKIVHCTAYDKGTKFDYSVDNSYSVKNINREINTDLQILRFVKSVVYHHLIKHQPDFLCLNAEDSKDRGAEKKKERIYARFLEEIPKNVPKYKLNYNPSEGEKPYNVYLEGEKTVLIVQNCKCEEHYYNGLLNSETVNPTQTHIKDNIYLLSGYKPAIHWLDGKLDCYYINGNSISYPYVKEYSYNGIKKYYTCYNWELKEAGIDEQNIAGG